MNTHKQTKRKRAEENIRRLATVVRDSNDAITIQDFEGRLITWNSGAERMYGYSEEEALQMKIGRLTPPDKDAEQKEFTRRLMAGETVSSFETQRVTKDGRILDVWLTVTKLMDDAGKPIGIASTERDITERKRAEKDLRDSEARYRTLFEASVDGILIADVATKAFKLANPAMCRMLGYTEEELRTLGVADIHPKEDLQHAMAEFEALTRGDKVLAPDIPCLRKDGTIFYANIASIQIAIEGKQHNVGFFRDITERKWAEKALRASEARYWSYIEVTGQLAWTTNTDGEVDDIAVWRKFTGQSVEEVKGWGWSKALHPDDVERTAQIWRKAVETKTSYETEYRIRRYDGIYRDFLARGVPVLNDDGSIREWVGTSIDITERKRAEEALRESNRRLQEALKKLQDMQGQMIQQERLSALGQMASGIAHDFNNALVPILGYTEILLSTPDILDNRKEAVEMLELVRAGAINAGETVRRMHEFYRPLDLLQQEPVDLSVVIRNTVALTRPKWKEEMEAKGIPVDIRTELAPAPPILGEEDELSRLLTNLILNAVDAMPQGGSITIRLHPHASGKHAVLEVQDTGVGMSEEVRRRCFDPFFTTKHGRNVGLGLSVSHGIVQRHKGSIEIQSEHGKGAKFIVQLPVMGSQVAPMLRHKAPQGTQPEEKGAPPPDRLPPVPSLRVLFVDDEESARFLLRRYLEADGHTVKLAADGREGLRSFKAGRFDVVILDRAMPGMSGDELAAAIKARSPETPVIMLTGFGDIRRDQAEHPAGVDMIIGKPVTRQDLRRAMAEVMARKRARGKTEGHVGDRVAKWPLAPKARRGGRRKEET